MPRRMIDSEIWFNDKVASLPDAGRLLFIGITADNEGRLRASPKYLKAHIFPYDDDKSLEQLREQRDQCAKLGLIRVYSKKVIVLRKMGWSEQFISAETGIPQQTISYWLSHDVRRPSMAKGQAILCHSMGWEDEIIAEAVGVAPSMRLPL